jgi:hypothetical protein
MAITDDRLAEAGHQMKCYVHHDVDAVGVCSECGQGVCDVCAVRIGGKLYCKDDADRVFGSERGAPGTELLEVGGSKVGMILTLMGGSIFLFLAVLAAYSFMIGLSSVSLSFFSSASEANAALHGAAYLVIGMLATSIGALIGGGYLNSDEHSHRLQGGVIAIVSAALGLLVVLALPFAVIPGGSPDFFYAAAAGASIIFFAVEFGGFVLVLIGGALGITRK